MVAHFARRDAIAAGRFAGVTSIFGALPRARMARTIRRQAGEKPKRPKEISK
jgi:hypothetical protein